MPGRPVFGVVVLTAVLAGTAARSHAGELPVILVLAQPDAPGDPLPLVLDMLRIQLVGRARVLAAELPAAPSLAERMAAARGELVRQDAAIAVWIESGEPAARVLVAIERDRPQALVQLVTIDERSVGHTDRARALALKVGELLAEPIDRQATPPRQLPMTAPQTGPGLAPVARATAFGSAGVAASSHDGSLVPAARAAVGVSRGRWQLYVAGRLGQREAATVGETELRWSEQHATLGGALARRWRGFAAAALIEAGARFVSADANSSDGRRGTWSSVAPIVVPGIEVRRAVFADAWICLAAGVVASTERARLTLDGRTARDGAYVAPTAWVSVLFPGGAHP